MPSITINGKTLPFEKGQTILQVALDNEIEIPHYCYHPGISIAANCRICLAECWAPNPRNENKLESMGKLLPTCQQTASDGMVVYTDSPKAIANQKAVMEYLLINHPVDCPVCDQAGECHLQDYSYQYGRSQSRFQEEKIKQPKKDVGPHVLLYSDRCIMCTRCVRFTREVTGTAELMVTGRGAMEQIDVFPGKALDNPLSANVIDMCPVGALLDKDFLFQQRVWFLTKTPSIDGITCSGDNISIEHNDGRVYRIKPRVNLDVNRYWITDEVRYGWKFIHDENRLRVPRVRSEDAYDVTEAVEAYESAYAHAIEGLRNRNLALLVSPMLSCEDAYLLGKLAMQLSEEPVFAIGPIPRSGEDQTFKDGYTMYAEKAPNARGVRRVLEKLSGIAPLEYDAFIKSLKKGNIEAAIITGNYPSDWVLADFADALRNVFTVAIDTLPNRITAEADVVLPGATWAEKAGTFESIKGRLQAFERAIDPIDYCKSESQIAMDLIAEMVGESPWVFNALGTRQYMATQHGMNEFIADVHLPVEVKAIESDMQVVEL